MALGTDYAQQDCTLARALEVVGERWSLLIVRDAFYGVRRFNDFLVHLDIPRAVLTARLAALTEAGVLRKEAYQQSPPRYDYVLTDAGLDLWPPLHALMRWGGRHASRGEPTRTFHHAACGSRLDMTGGCPACEVAQVAPADVEMRWVSDAGRPGRVDQVAAALATTSPLLRPVRGAAGADAFAGGDDPGNS
ncbi:helix-turn-helix transcriptional regulator [Streptomyces cocklensis]|jgi:DNA-binding HxlR family transcriptional regulator|uniref:Transcriptional regulator, HxlR family n=1 Tax=Actinacidiphila cocklensis TaxID=887465 RepID=A0A9W4DMV3_9ACTN|nr:helix-turn-helix domain-containing protein [Actinacidiphila cocklensis]MDD1059316.1 helix-turn-helix transcriptional regulator [Actinacidiphila cocklensis]WSX73180.1 helix-turn-helix transcriptional regulator [Streptomyces sp. NBC_00899]WSX80754.1 helix-turn-helix transcriptional regulator [Streptomyces sp. NBC_00899]CAG6392523.1 Transcriptional regulator, HxlR family [Actinacidiphila cocklensis]